VSTNLIYASERFILCRVQHPHQIYAPFYTLNISAPTSSNFQQRIFFQSILNMLNESADSIDLTRLIFSGDFNYDCQRDVINGKGLHAKTSLLWVSFLQESFYNCMLHNDLDTIPTFQRSVEITSCIDYIHLHVN
jgi:hypothetical protein